MVVIILLLVTAVDFVVTLVISRLLRTILNFSNRHLKTSNEETQDALNLRCNNCNNEVNTYSIPEKLAIVFNEFNFLLDFLLLDFIISDISILLL